MITSIFSTLMSWIVPRAAGLTEESVLEHCRGNIAHFKVPRYLRFVEEFPMTVTGKPQKFVMRDQMVADLGL